MAHLEPSEQIDGIVVVKPESHGDARGRFVETYRRSWFPLGREMVQGNRSEKQAGAVVGLHYHLHQADYWYATRGRILVVLRDLRVGSPTEGNNETFEIGEHNDWAVFIPPGVGHGFSTLEDSTLTYLVDSYYNPDDENGVAWDDPAMGLDWQVTEPVLSPRDQSNPLLKDLPLNRQPHYGLRR